LLLQYHLRAIREATVVASVAQKLHNSALAQRPDAIYLPNAVQEDHFKEPLLPNPALADLDFKRIIESGYHIAGYYGAIANWFDYDLLCETARLLPDWHFILIGPDYDKSISRSKLNSVKNISWLGPKNYDILPGYLHLFDVAMIPFKINDITLATSPLKLYEFFAARKPVVTTPMPECMAFKEVLIASNPGEFARSLEKALLLSKDPEYCKHIEAIVAENTWIARVKYVLSALSERMNYEQ
jgi:hypothetical protein